MNTLLSRSFSLSAQSLQWQQECIAWQSGSIHDNAIPIMHSALKVDINYDNQTTYKLHYMVWAAGIISNLISCSLKKITNLSVDLWRWWHGLDDQNDRGRSDTAKPLFRGFTLKQQRLTGFCQHIIWQCVILSDHPVCLIVWFSPLEETID